MLNKEYIIGLVDGEGSFNVQIRNDRKKTRVQLKFSVKLRHQDKEILYELQKFFGCGTVYIQKDKRKNHSTCYRFEVQNKKDIKEKIIPFFQSNLPKIASRKRDFELFQKIEELSNNQPIDFQFIQNIKNQMHWGARRIRENRPCGGNAE